MSFIFIFSVTILTIVRLIGLGVGLDFFLGTKRQRFLVQVLGWFTSSLAGFCHLLSFLIEDVLLKELFFLLFGVFTSVGVFLITLSIMLYFKEATRKIAILICGGLTCLPILLYLIFGLDIAVNFSLYSTYLIIAGIYLLGVIEKTAFKREVGASIKWFYAIIIVGIVQVLVILFLTSQGYNLGVYDAHFQDDFLILVNNAMSIGLLALTVVLLIHLETSRSERYSYRLKDKYSHDLGNIIQVIIGGMQLVESKQIADTEKRDTLLLINQKCAEVAELIHEIRNL